LLSDGTAFLTGRGLARLCGISNARIVELGQNWDTKSTNAMVEGVKEILRSKSLMNGGLHRANFGYSTTGTKRR
jgi:hypothetical protein